MTTWVQMQTGLHKQVKSLIHWLESEICYTDNCWVFLCFYSSRVCTFNSCCTKAVLSYSTQSTVALRIHAVVWSFTPKMFDFSPAKLLKFQIQLTSLNWPFAQPSVQITAKSRGHLKVSSRVFIECGTIPTFCSVVQLVRNKKKPLITLLYWFNTVIMEHLVDNVFYSHTSIFQLTWQRFEGEFILCQEKKMELLC